MRESTSNLIVLFIGALCVVQTISQVCPYSVKECSCDSSIACYDLLQIPPLNTGASVSKFTELTFRDGNVTSIPNNSLPPGLTSIELYHLPLLNIAEDAFDSSADTLDTMIIRETQLTSLPTALKKLTKLTVLFIYDTPIQVWDPATLKQIGATVVNLQLKNVTLSAWPSWISDFVSLLSVDLSWNPLKYIPVDAFSSFKNSVRFLYLRGTGLTDIPQALCTLSSMSYLDLDNNNFTYVSVFEQITKSPFAEILSALYLDSCGLTGVANFTNLTNIRVIVLSNNRISDVPPGSLPTSLTSLDLSKNYLVSVPKDVASLTKLSYLDLSNNQLTDIQPKSFPSSLVELLLNNNNLRVLTNTTFRDLGLLQHLFLNYNPISTIEPAAFLDLVSVQYLSMLNFNLTEIPLALAMLSPGTLFGITTTQPLSCPCPAPQGLVQWYSSFGFRSNIPTLCSNGHLTSSYLHGQCG